MSGYDENLPDPLRGSLAMVLQMLQLEGYPEIAKKLREKWTQDLQMLVDLMAANDALEAEQADKTGDDDAGG